MIDHQKVLSGIPIALDRTRAGDVEQFDRQAAGGADAVLLERILRVGESHNRREGLSRAGKDAIPQADWHVVGNSELRRDTTGRLGVLSAAELSVDHLHLVDGKGDHALEHVWVVERRILAIQFWFHCSPREIAARTPPLRPHGRIVTTHRYPSHAERHTLAITALSPIAQSGGVARAPERSGPTAPIRSPRHSDRVFDRHRWSEEEM